jgi:uncharacterized protein (TIGR02300 family)
MHKPKLGTKRSCQACEAHFYDLNHRPVLCPKCNAEFIFDAPGKIRKPRKASTAVEKKPAVKKLLKTENEEVNAALEATSGAEETTEVIDGDDPKEERLIEDTSELGEDEDDMAEVREHMEKPED